MRKNTLVFIMISILIAISIFSILYLRKPELIDKPTIERFNAPIFDDVIGHRIESAKNNITEFDSIVYSEYIKIANIELNKSKKYLSSGSIVSAIESYGNTVYFLSLMQNKEILSKLGPNSLNFSFFEHQYRDSFNKLTETEEGSIGTSINKYEWLMYHTYKLQLMERNFRLAKEDFENNDSENYLRRVALTSSLSNTIAISLYFSKNRVQTGIWFIEVEQLESILTKKYRKNIDTISNLSKRRVNVLLPWLINTTKESSFLLSQNFHWFTNYFYSEKLIAELNFFDLYEEYKTVDKETLRKQLAQLINFTQSKIDIERKYGVADYAVPDLMLHFANMLLENHKSSEEIILGIAYAKRADYLVDDWYKIVNELISKRKMKHFESKSKNIVDINCNSIEKCIMHLTAKIDSRFENTTIVSAVDDIESVIKIESNGEDITPDKSGTLIIPIKKGTNSVEYYIHYKPNPVGKISNLLFPNSVGRFIYPFNAYEIIFTLKLNVPFTNYKLKIPEGYYLDKSSGLYYIPSKFGELGREKEYKIINVDFYPSPKEIVTEYFIDEKMLKDDNKQIVVILNDATKNHKFLFFAYIIFFLFVNYFYITILKTAKTQYLGKELSNKQRIFLDYIILLFGPGGIILLITLGIPFSIFYMIPIISFFFMLYYFKK